MGKMSPPLISDLLRKIEIQAPLGAAENWDNVGLLVGDSRWKTRGAVVSIDLTEDAIRIAREKGFRLIVNHHPCIFPKSRGLSRVVAGGSRTRPSDLVFETIRQGIAVAAYHTNFDRSALEVIQAVSRGLGAEPKGRLLDHPSGALVKLVVFVPVAHLDRVRNAIFEAGAGHIGHYDCCGFGAEGEGTYRPGENTKPFQGEKGRLEKAHEVRLETVIPRGLERLVLDAMLKAHPYEEVAYDLYPIEQTAGQIGLVKGLGYGFWGEFPKAKSFSEVVKSVRTTFKIKGFLLSDPAPARVRRIGFAAGKGASFVDAAIHAGCDLFITGEAGYHEALSASRRGMAIMEIGHRESELFFLKTMKRWLEEAGLASGAVVESHRPTQKFY